MRIESLPPRSPCIRKQYIHMLRRLGDLLHQLLDLLEPGYVSGHGDRPRPGPEVGQAVERGDGGCAGRGFARGDVDFGRAGLEEPRYIIQLLETPFW